MSTSYDIKDKVVIRDFNKEVEPESITEIFSNTVKKHGDRIAMMCKHNNSCKEYTWNQYYYLSKTIAAAFLKIGLKSKLTGLDCGVAIIGFNSPEWLISNMATIIAGGVSVGIYTTNSAKLCKYIIKDSNSVIAVVDTGEQVEKLLSINTKIKLIIQYRGNIKSVHKKIKGCHGLNYVISWKEFINFADKVEVEWLRKISDDIHKLDPSGCASLIYTSGTTGKPKGVMLSHDNIIWTTKQVLSTVKINKLQRVVSYVPLSHIAGQMVDIYMILLNGGTTWFAEPTALKGTLVDTLKEAKPTIFLGVPRVWEKIMEKMLATNLSDFKKHISDNAKKIGLKRYHKIKNKSKYMSWYMYNSLVYKKVKQMLGLDKCKLLLTGAAPIKKETLEYFASLNMPIYEIYGMSECAGPMTISFPGTSKINCCGKILPHTKIKIIPETGEICTNGRHVMMGYLNKSKKTNDVIDGDGWLHSGDIGSVDENGFVTIIGRIKELLITAGGENIPPVPIENCIKKELPILSNCMLICDKKKYITCIVSLKCIVDDNGRPTNDLDPTVIKQLQDIDSSSKTVAEAIKDNKVKTFIKYGILMANEKSVSNAQKVQKCRIIPIDFSIDGGELGPTLKLKRHTVLNKYKDIIDSMYKE
jgi:long-chain-fatty-acid--CoA ligase ACSBG